MLALTDPDAEGADDGEDPLPSMLATLPTTISVNQLNLAIAPGLPRAFHSLASLLSLSYSLHLTPLSLSLHSHVLQHLHPGNSLPLLALSLHLHHHHSHLLPPELLRSTRAYLCSLIFFFAQTLHLAFGTEVASFPLLPDQYHTSFSSPVYTPLERPGSLGCLSEHCSFIFGQECFACPELYLYARERKRSKSSQKSKRAYA